MVWFQCCGLKFDVFVLMFTGMLMSMAVFLWPFGVAWLSVQVLYGHQVVVWKCPLMAHLAGVPRKHDWPLNGRVSKSKRVSELMQSYRQKIVGSWKNVRTLVYLGTFQYFRHVQHFSVAWDREKSSNEKSRQMQHPKTFKVWSKVRDWWGWERDNSACSSLIRHSPSAREYMM